MPKDSEKNKKSNYGAEDIFVLEGLEPVRKRPGMYIGSTGTEGLHHLVWEVSDNALDEAMGGYAKNISISLLAGNQVKVTDDGRGIPVEVHKQTKKSTLETVMTTLHAGAKFGGDTYKIAGGLHGVGVSVVNALSTYLRAEIYRDGNAYAQEYKIGIPKGDVKKIGKSGKNGTTVIFEPDASVFNDTNFDWKKIVDHFRQKAYLIKGIKISLSDERHKDPSEHKFYGFYFEGGIKSYIKYLNQNYSAKHRNIFYCEKTAEKILVEIALQYIDDLQSREISFANNIYTPEGGTHLTGFRIALTRCLNDYARKNGFLKESEENFTGEDVREGITAIISVALPEPQFEGQTKAKLGSTEARSAVESVFSEKFSQYLEENPSDAKDIIEKVVLALKARKAAKAAKESVLRKGALEGLTLPGKLADCQSRKPEESELFIVEGDSAGGCFCGDTKLALTDGRNLSFKELIKEYLNGKKNYCYTIKDNGDIGIALIENPRRTKQSAEIIKIILDNNEEILCTPDHLFMLKNKSYKKAKDLTSNDSLMPFIKKISKIGGRITIDGYEMVYNSKKNEWIFTHLLADKYNLENNFYTEKPQTHKHHIDFNKLNNNPENIIRMEKEDHLNYHRKMLKFTLHKKEVKEKCRQIHKSKEYKEKVKKIMNTPEMKKELSKRAKKQWENAEYKKYMNEKFLEFYHSNEEYRKRNNAQLNKVQKIYWADEKNKQKQSEKTRKYFENNPEKKLALSKLAKKEWQNSDLIIWRRKKTKEQWTKDFRIKRKESYNQTYLKKALETLYLIYKSKGIIGKEEYNEIRKLKNDKSIIKYETICSRFFKGDEHRLEEAVVNYNHRIKNIVYLKEKIDVYDIEVADTHNFALASGIFVHNSGKTGRDRRTQAILPLKGKILNVEKARIDKMMAFKEIRALIIAIGTSIGEDINLAKLRYHKIIIATDADVDGAHIRTLLLTFFYRYLRPLIENGYLYIATPPLYGITYNKKTQYAYSDHEKEKIINEIQKEKEIKAKDKAAAKAKKEEPREDEDQEINEAEQSGAETQQSEAMKGISIQRYKGLGEMNPEQLWETTMNPQKRILKQVNIEDAVLADQIFDTLMGSEPAPRKIFIQTYAKAVKNLDI